MEVARKMRGTSGSSLEVEYMVDEGCRGVAVDDVVGEEAPAGWRTEQGVGFCRGFSWPPCTNGWAWDGSREPWLRDALVQNVG